MNRIVAHITKQNISAAIIMRANFNMLLMIISKISRNSSILSFIFLIYLCILFQETGIPALKSLLQDTVYIHYLSSC